MFKKKTNASVMLSQEAQGSYAPGLVMDEAPIEQPSPWGSSSRPVSRKGSVGASSRQVRCWAPEEDEGGPVGQKTCTGQERCGVRGVLALLAVITGHVGHWAQCRI